MKKPKKRNYEHIYIQQRVKSSVHKDKSKEIPRKKKHKERLQDDRNG